MKSLYKLLGYEFQDAKLLELALRHRSCGHDNNERLEFLGDSILNFVMAEVLYHRFPEAKEGQLSRLRADLVNGETLAQIAKRLQLSDFIMVGPGERRTGGYQRTSTLSDCVESLIAAIYLESGLEVARRCIHAWFSEEIEKTALESIQKDPKSELQELLQAQGLKLPTYDLIKVSGKEHEQIFTVGCLVSSLEEQQMGEGSSRRMAEQQAAKRMLEKLKNAL